MQSTSTVTMMSENCWTLLLMALRPTRRREGQTERKLDRPAESGVYETVDIPVALGMMRLTRRWELDHGEGGIRARLVAREFKSDETMYDIFAPSSTPST